MTTNVDSNRIHQTMLDVINDESAGGRSQFSPTTIIEKAAARLAGDREDMQLKRALLDYWGGLMRGGQISFGTVDGNWDSGNFHLTKDGMAAVTQASRDPTNQAGYLAYLDTVVKLEDVARGYVEEALNTYRACCYKATAILIGAAVERVALSLRDELVQRLNARHVKLPKGLDAWQVKTALETVAKKILPDLEGEVRKTKDEGLRKLYEEATARLLPIAAEFRRTRNDAGHPASLDPIHPADVHSNLLLFPAAAKVLLRLKDWVTTFYA